MGCAQSKESPTGDAGGLRKPVAMPTTTLVSAGNSQTTHAEALVEAKPMRDSVQDQLPAQGPTAGKTSAPLKSPASGRLSGKAPHDQRTSNDSTTLPGSSGQGAPNGSSGSLMATAGADRTSGVSAVHSGANATGPAARASSARSSFAVDSGVHALGDSGRQRSAKSQEKAAAPDKLQDAAPPPPVAVTHVPEAITPYFQKLSIVPSETPVPATMLQRLWQRASLPDTLPIITQLQLCGVLRVATLDDGSLWCLVAGPTLAYLQETYKEQASSMHAALLDAYMQGPRGQSMQLRDVEDDGYIVQNVATHLLGSGRTGSLRGLLGEPSWLEAKLLAYGTAPVVSDFRRYLTEVPDDTGARLLLQALQLSLGCCAANPGARMLREQMLSRLMVVAQQDGGGDGAAGGALGAPPTGATMMLRPSMGGLPPPLPNMLASVSGLERDGSTTTGLRDDTATGLTGSQMDGTTLSAALRDPTFNGPKSSLREWFEYQSSRAAMDICTAAGATCVHLLPRSASLKQAGGVQRMILKGHTAPVCKVVISPNGQDVLTVSEDGSAQVWDMNVGDCVMQLARKQPLTDVCVAPGGCLCVVASEDGAACVWDLASGAVRHVLTGHTGKINSVAIDQEGLRCVTASNDRSVRVWSITEGECEAVLAGHGKSVGSGAFGLVFDVALSSDGCLAATASEDFTARVWDLTTLKCMHVLEGHSGWVVSVAWVGDTTHLITASHDSTARVWDGLRGCCLHVLEGHTARLSRVRVDVTGTCAVTCSDDNTARVWDVETGVCKSVLRRHDAWVSDAALSRADDRCVTVGGDGLVCVWDRNTGELQATLEGHTDALHSVVLTSGGRFAVTTGVDTTARVWDLGAGLEQLTAARQRGHVSRVHALRALQGGRQVVSACDDGEVVVWDVGTCAPVDKLRAHSGAVSFLDVSADGTRVMSGSANRQVCCWSMPGASLVGSLEAQQGSRAKQMAFSATGGAVAMVLYDSSTTVWDLNKGALIATLMDRGERVGRNVHTGGVNGVLLCGGLAGTATAVTWSKDCTARVWDVATASVRLVLTGHTDGVRVATLSRDQTVLATASYGACVRLHLMGTGAPLAVLDHAAPATQLEFSPDGRWLAVALENNTVVMWDLVAHSCLPPLQAHKSEITHITYSPDSTVLATCSQDCSVRVWDARTGRQLAFFVCDVALTACCFAGGSLTASDILVVGDASGALHFLDLPPELQPDNAMY